ncbi:hypothetical protein E2320_008636, partial [Naja naja]
MVALGELGSECTVTRCKHSSEEW